MTINMTLDQTLKLYDYNLPKELIAQKPASPRDSARLLVYDRKNKKVNFDRFSNIGRYLPKNCVLVFNQTKVWPARLSVKKTSGGKADLLYIDHDKNFIKALSNKKLSINSCVTLLCGRTKVYNLTVAKKSDQFYYFKPSFPISKLLYVLDKCGITPLPPYIKNSPLSEKQRREQYQTVFAKNGLSVAAPTASLHFTDQLMTKLKRQGIAIKFARLDVGLGTFAPLKENNLQTGKLHYEYYQIDRKTADFLNRSKKQKRPIIAVGTTAVRTLESSSKNHQLKKLSGQTDLFIREGYKFNFVDGLITNFHVPKSSLLMLVSALAGRKTIFKLYNQAINKKFRFFSFGDGMLIL